MRISVFSDIHSNLEALTAFINHASTKNIDRYVCLGDIVGYGANPGSNSFSAIMTMPPSGHLHFR